MNTQTAADPGDPTGDAPRTHEPALESAAPVMPGSGDCVVPPDCYRCGEERDDAYAGLLGWATIHMFVCPDCGNKRCPRATDHRHDCTASNEPGQPGSRFPAIGLGTVSG